MERDRRRVLAAIATGLAGGVAGCSSGGDGDTPQSTDSEPTTTETPDGSAADATTDEPTDAAPAVSTPSATITSSLPAQDAFGRALAVTADGDSAFVGNRRFSNDRASISGGVEIFDRSGDGWERRRALVLTDFTEEDVSGLSETLAIDDAGETVLMAARHAGGSFDLDGRVFVLEAADEGWTRTRITAAESSDSDGFGLSSLGLAGDGSRAIVGASNRNDESGAAFVFDRAGGEWAQQAALSPSIDGRTNSEVGEATALADAGSLAFVGGKDTGDDLRGHVSVFSGSGGNWSQSAIIRPDEELVGVGFGNSLEPAADGSRVLVSAPYETVDGTAENGAAYVFERNGGEFQQIGRLAPQNPQEDAGFGRWLSLSGDGSTALIGAPAYRGDDGVEIGRAYVFAEQNGEWQLTERRGPPSAVEEGRLGQSLGTDRTGETTLVGAPYLEFAEARSHGAVYEYD